MAHSELVQPNVVYELQINVSINKMVRYEGAGGFNHTGERLSVDERIAVRADGFAEVCAILGRFHELSEKIKEARGDTGPASRG